MFLKRAVALLGLAFAVAAKSSAGDSVLVVLDSSVDRDSYSIFFDGLTERGYNLTFRSSKDTKPVVIEDDVAQFAHVVVFAPDSKSMYLLSMRHIYLSQLNSDLAQDLTPQALVSLLSKGTNLLLALSPKKQTVINSLASEFSLILPPPGTPLVSHFPERDTPSTVVPVSLVSSNPILSSATSPVWFSGVPFAYSPNPLLVPILSAPAESFAADTTSDAGADAVVESADKGGEGLWAGSQMALVAGFQTTNGARAAFIGGVEVFSDEFIQKPAVK
jgi:oligosaccharyltransferase complex subunit beta